VTVVPLVEMVELLIGFVGFCGLSLLNGIVITFTLRSYQVYKQIKT
jgi:hypothetical protein